MTNKTELQKELKEKIKAGIKPSDLKRSNNPTGKPVKKPLPSPYKTEPELEKDLGYESDSSDKSIPIPPPLPNKQIKQLQQDLKYWTNTAQTHLSNLQQAQAKVSNLEESNNLLLRDLDKYREEVKELKKIKPHSELLTEKDKQIEIIAKENEKNQQKANKATELLNKQGESVRRAKEVIQSLEAEKERLNKTIEELKNQGENTIKDKEETTKTFLLRRETSFFCDSCQLTKQGNYVKRKVDAPLEPRLHKRVCYLCSTCSLYCKELSEVEFDKDDNPYKVE